MRTYGQYCPISRASEILAERWTPLVIRNLLLGCSTFNAIADGLPGMSRTLLTKRLRELEDAGVVASSPKRRGRGSTYTLTEAGRGLWNVMAAMNDWAEQWIQHRPEHSDPTFVLWAWCHVYARRDRLPERRVTVRFDFPDQRPPHHRMWILFERSQGADLCHTPPGFEEDLVVEARSVPFVKWHLGELSWQDALGSGGIRVAGPRGLSRALPTWNAGAQAGAPRGSSDHSSAGTPASGCSIEASVAAASSS